MAAYVFTDGEVATAAKLNSLLPPTVVQAGLVRATPTAAGEATSVSVTFPRPFGAVPKIFATPVTTVPGSVVKPVTVLSVSKTGAVLVLDRANATTTTIGWQAWGALPAAFADGSFAYASLLNAGGAELVTRQGVVSITPSASSPTSKSVSFGSAFTATPVVVLTPVTSVPGTTVQGWSATEMTTSGFKAWVYRTNSTATDLHWIAAGRA